VCVREREEKKTKIRLLHLKVCDDVPEGKQTLGRIKKKKKKGKVNTQAKIFIGIIQITASPH